jgi:hypothetical protein
MRRLPGVGSALVTAVLAGLLLLPGCWGESADQMMRTAEFEELQRNHEHARQIYERVIERFPGSPEARKAADRLATLEQE